MVTKLPTPVYSTKYGQAYLGDLLELLKGVPDDSVDLIFTSPSYFEKAAEIYNKLLALEPLDFVVLQS